MKRSGARGKGESASQMISRRIAELDDWRGETLGRIRALIKEAALFNSSLEGNTRRAIDIHEGEAIDASALKALIRAAVALNASGRDH